MQDRVDSEEGRAEQELPSNYIMTDRQGRMLSGRKLRRAQTSMVRRLKRRHARLVHRMLRRARIDAGVAPWRIEPDEWLERLEKEVSDGQS